MKLSDWLKQQAADGIGVVFVNNEQDTFDIEPEETLEDLLEGGWADVEVDQAYDSELVVQRLAVVTDERGGTTTYVAEHALSIEELRTELDRRIQEDALTRDTAQEGVPNALDNL